MVEGSERRTRDQQDRKFESNREPSHIDRRCDGNAPAASTLDDREGGERATSVKDGLDMIEIDRCTLGFGGDQRRSRERELIETAELVGLPATSGVDEEPLVITEWRMAATLDRLEREDLVTLQDRASSEMSSDEALADAVSVPVTK